MAAGTATLGQPAAECAGRLLGWGKTACAAWIYAGGAHHTAFSYAVTAEMMEDFAAMAGVELVVIDAETRLRAFKQELRDNDLYYHLSQGLTS